MGNEEWINGVRYLFEYDRKLKKNKIEQYWNSEQKEWQNTSKYSYYYNVEDELQEEDKYKWNSEEQKWILIRKMRYSSEKLDQAPSK
jgi:hypothetical protein